MTETWFQLNPVCFQLNLLDGQLISYQSFVVFDRLYAKFNKNTVRV